MSFFRQLSLRTQMLTVVACIILAGFALTLSILTWQAGQMQREAALQYAGELAAHNGRAAAVPLQQGLEAARTLAAAMVALKASGHADRETASAILRTVLEKNPRFIGVWTGWEPNAFDGRDADFASAAGHDATAATCPTGTVAEPMAAPPWSPWWTTTSPARVTTTSCPSPRAATSWWSPTPTRSGARAC